MRLASSVSGVDVNDDPHPGVKLAVYLSLAGLSWWCGWMIASGLPLAYAWLAWGIVGQ